MKGTVDLADAKMARSLDRPLTDKAHWCFRCETDVGHMGQLSEAAKNWGMLKLLEIEARIATRRPHRQTP